MNLEHDLAQLEHAQLVSPEHEEYRAYKFKHALTQDTVYESLLLKKRREIHRQIAEIFEREHVGDLEKNASLLAFHFARAGDSEKAVSYLFRAGDWAKRVGAPAQAIATYKSALALTQESNLERRADLFVRIGEVSLRQGDYQTGKGWLYQGLDLARAGKSDGIAAHALCALASTAVYQGEYAEGRQFAQEALELSRSSGERATAALALRWLGIISSAEADYDAAIADCKEGLAIYEELGDKQGKGLCLNSLGIFAYDQGDLDSAMQYLEQALALSREIGDRHAEGNRLLNLGTTAAAGKQFAPAKTYYEQSLAIAREVGSKEDIATIINNLGDIALLEGDDTKALGYYRDAIAQASAIGAVPLLLFGVAGIATLRYRSGDYVRAAELLGFVTAHQSCDAELKKQVKPTLDELPEKMPAEALKAATERGGRSQLDQVMRELFLAD